MAPDALLPFVATEQVHAIVTDTSAPAEQVEAWQARGVEIVRVDPVDGARAGGSRQGSASDERHRPVMELTGVSKRFDATQALADVSLTLYPGETHALLGENGAGKSTLIKVMTGIHSPDAGVMRVGGEETTFKGSGEAQRAGIAAIYQEPAIFPDLNVAENIFMSHQDRGAVVRWRRMYRDAEAILARIDVRMDVRTLASGLTVASQQAVEIAKALSLDVRVLIMDEPTAALSAHEVSELFKQIRRLTDSGVAVLFISHRLDEVFEIADRVTVLRDGRLISSRPKAGGHAGAGDPGDGRPRHGGLLRPQPAAAGRRRAARRRPRPRGRLQRRRLRAARAARCSASPASSAPAAPTSRWRCSGSRRPTPAPSSSTAGGSPPARRARRCAPGIAYLSEDRRALGLSLPQSITANITLATLRKYVTRLRLLDSKAEREVAGRFREKLNIRTPSLDTPVEQLSGGNQQKTMLAKWLNAQPRVLILDEPTRGIDVGAKAEVHQIVDELAASGMAIILISSDLPEVIAMSDRVLVMREGRQMGIFERAEADEERIITAAMGAAECRPERLRELSLLAVLAVAILIFSLLIDNYLGGSFFNRVTTSVAITAILAAGQTIVILTRNIDLSVGSIVGVTAYVTGEYLHDHPELAPVLAVAYAVAIGGGLGLLNGALVAYARVPSIIVTLGTLAIFRTWLINHSDSRTITSDGLPDWVLDLPNSTLVSFGEWDVRTVVLGAVVLIVVLQLMLGGLKWGALGLRRRLQPGRRAPGRAAGRAGDPRRRSSPPARWRAWPASCSCRASGPSPSTPATGSSWRPSRPRWSAASTSSAARGR